MDVYGETNTMTKKTEEPEAKYKVQSTSMTAETTTLSPKTIKTPVVRYTELAWNKIKHLVKICPLEVGWWGTVDTYQNGSMYLITDIFIPKQTVTGAETDILAEDLADIVVLVPDPEKLIYWGHSHVNMRVVPSGQDEDQTLEYLEHMDVFIRGIYNKKGESKVDVYDTNAMLAFQCVDNRPMISQLSDEDKTLMEAVVEQNVKKRTYGRVTNTTTKQNSNTGQSSTASSGGKAQEGRPTNFRPKKPRVKATGSRGKRVVKKLAKSLKDSPNPFVKKLVS